MAGLRVSNDRRKPVSDEFREIVWRIGIGVVVLEVSDASEPGSTRILFANPAALAMKDFRPQEVIGKTLREVLPDALHRFTPQQLADVMRQGIPVNVGHLKGIRHPERTYMVNVVPLPRQQLGVLFEDITEQLALADSEDRFWKALQAAPFAMGIIRARDGTVREANRRFLELFGFEDRDAILGRSAQSLHLWAQPGEFEHVLGELAHRGELREIPLEGLTRDGFAFRALAALEPIKFEGENCVLTLFWRS